MYDIKYTEEQLKKCSLNYLRSYARDLGGTPSLKKKDELVRYILDIQDDKFVPERKKSGRKPLNSTNMSYDWLALLDFGDGDLSVSRFEDSGHDGSVNGYLNVLSDGIGVLKNTEYKSQIFVAKAMIEQYRLRDGDIIDGAVEKTKNNAFVLTKLQAVNGEDLSKAYNRLDFKRQPAVYPCHKISFVGLGEKGRLIDIFSPIGKGQRCLVQLSNGDDTVSLTEKFCEEMKKSGVKPIVAYPDCRPEDGEYLAKTCEEVMWSSFDHSAAEHIKEIKNAISRATRIAEGGEDSAVIFGSLKAIERTLGQEDEFGIKQLFSSAKNTETCHSVTMVVFSDDEMLADRYGEYFNCIITLRDDGLDILKSFTRRSELLLGSERHAIANKARAKITLDKSEDFIYNALGRSSDERGFLEALA